MAALGVPVALIFACVSSPARGNPIEDEPAEGLSPPTEKPGAAAVSYHRDVVPIFRANCLGCHQGAKRQGGYVMTDHASLLRPGDSGEPAVVPGAPESSYLIQRITPVDGHAEMPEPPLKPLRDSEILVIARWIAEGAKDDTSAAVGESYDLENPPIYRNAPTITSVDLSADGRWIAAAGHHEVWLLDSVSGATERRLIGLSPRINSVRFSPDSARLAVAAGTPCVSGELQVWDVESGELQHSIAVTHDTLTSVRWSPDGSQIAFGCADNTLRAIDAETGQPRLYQGAHEDWVLDATYTVDGKHLVSVARDMTCKLTEVATERFIDNVTSITPGALSGGLHSIDRHPERDELLLGGADGIAKVYRVFRETERRIGDDANLIRKLPAMAGRIFSVAVSPDGSRLAAAATLDGKSEIRVWNYDFTGVIPEEIKRLSAKRVADLSDEEKKVLSRFQNAETTQVWQSSIDDAAIYTIRFSNDNALFAAGSDGRLRRFDAQGASLPSWDVVPDSRIDRGQSETRTARGADLGRFDALAYGKALAERIEDAGREIAPNPEQVISLVTEPQSVALDGPFAYTQLIVTAHKVDGSAVDVTRQVTLAAPAFVTLSPSGVIRPITDGEGKIVVRYGDQETIVALAATGTSDQSALDFIQDVNPVLSRLGCNQGTCHGAQAGKNGFKLSLRGYDPLFDIRSLTDDHASRRVNTASPDDSLMLLKPLGVAPHQGGTLMTHTDPSFTILRNWIADGCRLNLSSARVTRIEVSPTNPVISMLGARQQVRVEAIFSDGNRRDVTAEAFVTSGNTEVAEVDSTGLLTAVRRGEAPILARYEGAYAATTLTVMGERDGFEWSPPPTWSRIDEFVSDKWQRLKILPSGLCSDEEFLRRVCLDLTGLPPTSSQIRTFLADTAPTQQKRAAIIDRLMAGDEFVEFWTNKWADLLQVNRKFLGISGSSAYRDWIRQSVASNQPYDEFAREILTASGSNLKNPPASYFKVLREAEDTMENTTHLFLGVRFNCNKCHDHPFERWTQDQYFQTAAFFARTSLRADPASGKETIGGSAVDGAKPLYEEVYEADTGDVIHQRTGKPVEPMFPYEIADADSPLGDGPSYGTHQRGSETSPEPDGSSSRRDQLAAWMTHPDNPYFARSYVNRVWGYLMGVGLIEPIDDLRAGNPPTNPELLDHLTESFVASGFDRRHLLRMICGSRTYQLSVETNRWNEDDHQNYSHALARRLPAEVIYDAVHLATGSTSEIPGVPRGTRAAALPDAGVKLADGFLQNLGQPVRESACECERSKELQLGPVMALISGPTIGRAIADQSNDLAKLVRQFDDDQPLVEELYLRLLARKPNTEELTAFSELRQSLGLDHAMLSEQLARRESWWKEELPKRETAREAALLQVEQRLAAHVEAIRPERERLESEHEGRIAAAIAKREVVQNESAERQVSWEKQQADNVEWFPLVPSVARGGAGDRLSVLEDRSILVSGKGEPSAYRLTFDTSLDQITGFRLEALTFADDDGKTVGPGLSANGNFVLTEFEVLVADRDQPEQLAPLVLASAEADFVQAGFKAEDTINGQTRGQTGWAVSGSVNQVHWIVFQTKSPIGNQDNKQLSIRLHQYHKAEGHRLGRFRISATTGKAEKISLGLAEPLRRIVDTPLAQRTAEQKEILTSYFRSVDPEIKAADLQLAEARKPIAEDAEVIALNQQIERLKKVTPIDSDLVRLREDVSQSRDQLKNDRLTAAEDLTWALINSPAFLFNR